MKANPGGQIIPDQVVGRDGLIRDLWETLERQSVLLTAERRILDIVCLNCTLDDASLCPTMRNSFDLLAKGLVWKDSRGDWTSIELFLAGLRGWEAGIRRALSDA